MNFKKQSTIVGIGILSGLLLALILTTLVGGYFPQRVVDTIPSVINYQGVLTDNEGNVLTGSHTMVFKLYTTSEGGAPVWIETQSVNTTNGLFNVFLGDEATLSSTVFDDGQVLYLGITVDSDAEMYPRFRLGSVPYAFSTNQCLNIWYQDADADNFGDPSSSILACNQPVGFVGNPLDCDDYDTTTYPGAPEACDGIDNDCDYQYDEDISPQACSLQEGVCSGSVIACSNGQFPACTASEYGPSYELFETTCDDDLDNDCDGTTDVGDSNCSSQ